MSAEEHLARVAFELSGNVVAHPQALRQPEWNGHQVRAQTARRLRDIRLEQALELDERLLVEADEIQIRGGDATLAQAIRDSVGWKRLVVFLAGEALFLGGSDNLAVHDQARRRV